MTATPARRVRSAQSERARLELAREDRDAESNRVDEGHCREVERDHVETGHLQQPLQDRLHGRAARGSAQDLPDALRLVSDALDVVRDVLRRLADLLARLPDGLGECFEVDVRESRRGDRARDADSEDRLLARAPLSIIPPATPTAVAPTATAGPLNARGGSLDASDNPVVPGSVLARRAAGSSCCCCGCGSPSACFRYSSASCSSWPLELALRPLALLERVPPLPERAALERLPGFLVGARLCAARARGALAAARRGLRARRAARRGGRAAPR